MMRDRDYPEQSSNEGSIEPIKDRESPISLPKDRSRNGILRGSGTE
jgi:hypothetical protein